MPHLRASDPSLFRVSLRVLVCVALLTCCWPAAFGQINFSTLRGTVTDSSGAIVSGATVTLNDSISGTVLRSQQTNEQGNYEFLDVNPGTYRLRGSRAGFKSYTADHLILTSGEVRRVDIPLPLGSASETVQVTAGAQIIDTETGQIGGVLDMQQIIDSPQIDPYPSPSVLLTTMPGIQGGTGGLGGLRISGQNSGQQSEAFDGVVNDLGGGNSNNPAFFKEINAISVNSPAENARLAYHNMTTRSGTNQFHGLAMYKINSSGLMARGYFAPRRAPYLQHTWQLGLGGPIIKDRTFFYATWFAEKIPLGSFVNATVPTDPMRAGNFSGQSATIKDPNNKYAAFPGKKLTYTSPVSQQFQNLFYPTATTNPGAGNYSTNNLGFAFPYPSDVYKGNWGMGRIDQKITSKNNMFARWLIRHNPYILQNGMPSELWTRWRDEQQWAISDTHVFSANLLNTFTAGMSREYIRDGGTIDGVAPKNGAQIIADTGLQGSNPGDTTGQGSPTMSIAGLTTMAVPSGGVQSNNYIYTYMDSVSWAKGRHVMKFGASYQTYRNFVGAVPSYGTATFDGSMSGNAYADFLLGIPRQTTRSTPISNRTQHAGESGIFAEDTFKATNNLTLSYGLRWDYVQSPSYDDQMAYSFDPVTNQVLVPAAALSKVSPLYSKTGIPVVAGKVTPDSKLTNFRPRVSAAYRITPSFVLRGGYGAFTERIGYFTMLSGAGPFAISETYQNQPGQAPVVQFPNPYPSDIGKSSVPSQSVAIFPSQANNGTLHQFNITAEKEVGRNGLRISYVGIRGTGLNYSLNINKPQPSTIPFTTARRPFSNLVTVTEYRHDGSSHYNSLQLEAKRRTNHLTFDVNYSYQRNLANFFNVENPYDVLSHWANETATRHHYLSGNVTWRLPFGRNEQYFRTAPAAVDQAIGGWQLYFVTYFASGLFYSPSFSGTNPANTGDSGGLPDQIGSTTPKHRTYQQWWDKDAFALPQPGHFGNALPYSLEGQGLNVQHLSVIKRFPIRDRVSFVFTTAISNLLNHPHFYGAQSNISTSNFGAFTSQYGLQTTNESAAQRQVSFYGRIEF